MNRWRCPSCKAWTFDEMGKTCLDCKEDEEMARQPRPREGAPDGWTTDDWATPQDVFDQIAAEFGPFDLDPAARADTAKADVFYTKEENGLILPWFGTVWINPPYSDPQSWVQRAAIGDSECVDVKRIVMLLPADISTVWFHKYVKGKASWQPVRGRMKFVGPVKGSPKGGNIIAVYPPTPGTDERLEQLIDRLVLPGQRRAAA